MKKWMALLAWALIVAGCGTHDKTQEIKQQRQIERQRQIDGALAEVQQLAEAGKRDDAIYILRRVMIQIGPHEKLLMSCAYLRANAEEAIGDLTEAIRLNSNNAEAFQLRGMAYAEAGKPARAIADLDKAMEIEPKRALYCYLLKGQQYIYQQDYPKAIDELTEAIRLDSLNEDAFLWRGRAYEALAYNEPAIVDDEAEAKSGNWWGRLERLRKTWESGFQNSENCRKATADFQEVIHLVPEHNAAIAALERLARVQMAFDKFQAAKAAAERRAAKVKAAAERRAAEEKAVAANQELALGRDYLLKGELDKAIAHYTKAISYDPFLLYAYGGRGEAYRKKGEWDKAIADYTQVIKFDPTNGSAYGRRGEAYRQKGEFDKAIDDLLWAIRLDPTLAYAYHYRGEAYREKGDLDKASKDFAKAKELGYKP